MPCAIYADRAYLPASARCLPTILSPDDYFSETSTPGDIDIPDFISSRNCFCETSRYWANCSDCIYWAMTCLIASCEDCTSSRARWYSSCREPVKAAVDASVASSEVLP